MLYTNQSIRFTDSEIAAYRAEDVDVTQITTYRQFVQIVNRQRQNHRKEKDKMAKRFGRRTINGTMEYYDSRDECLAAQRRELAGNDRFNDKGNVGVTNATVAALAARGLLAVPQFGSDDGKHTDFNDLNQAEGPEAVQGCIKAALMVSLTDGGAVGATAVSTEVRAEADTLAINADGSTDVAALAKASKVTKVAKKAGQLASGLPYGFSISNEGVFSPLKAPTTSRESPCGYAQRCALRR